MQRTTSGSGRGNWSWPRSPWRRSSWRPSGPAWVLIGVGALAAAVLVATFGRAGGRWWYEAVASQRRFRRASQLAAEHVLAAAVAD